MNVRSLVLLTAAVMAVTGCSDGADVEQQPSLDAAWSVELPNDVGSKIYGAVANSKHVLVGTKDNIAVLDTQDGALLWSMPRDFDVEFYLYETSLIAVGTDGYGAWDAATGDELFNGDGMLFGWAALTSGLIVSVCAGSCEIAAIDPSSGDRVWQQEFERPYDLISEGRSGPHDIDRLNLPSPGTQVVLWHKSEQPDSGSIMDPETGEVRTVIDRDEDGDRDEAFFSSADRFTEWTDAGDGMTILTTFDTSTGEQVWTLDATSRARRVPGTSLIRVVIDDEATLVHAESGEPVHTFDDDLAYLAFGKNEAYVADYADNGDVTIVAQSLDESGEKWSTLIEKDQHQPAAGSSGISQSHVFYAYAVSTEEMGLSEQKTLVFDRHTGDTVRLSGPLLDPLFLGDDGLVTTCEGDTNCQVREQRTIGYFRLS